MKKSANERVFLFILQLFHKIKKKLGFQLSMIKKIHKKDVCIVLFFLFWYIYFFLLWNDMIVQDQYGVKVGWVSIWGDWAVHFTQGSAFAFRSFILTKNPVLITAPFSYPFFVNLLSAVFIRIFQTNFFSAFIFPSYMFSLLLVISLTFFYKTVFRSSAVAMIATFIFLLNGGLGFYWYIKDILGANFSYTSMFSFTKEYTHLYELGMEWINVITSMVVPQRSFALGFSIGILILLFMYLVVFNAKKVFSRKSFLLMGMLYGLMPIIHTHSFLMIALIGMFWVPTGFALLSGKDVQKKRIHYILFWGVFAVATLIVALPLLKVFFPSTLSSAAKGSFIRWYPGWYLNQDAPDFGKLNMISFWLLNWGVTLPLAIVGWMLQTAKKKIMLFPFMVIFVLANLFLWQPHIWDNTKVIVWSSLGISGLAGYALYRLYQHKWTLMKLAAGILFVITIFSGTLDAYMILGKAKHSWYMYTTEDQEMAMFIQKNTKKDVVILTSDVHNNAVTNLTGRQIVMGFRGWLWTYGLDYFPVERDIFSIYRGERNTEELLKKYDIQYVAFDEKVRGEWKGNEEYYFQQFPVFYRNSSYTIFDVRSAPEE